MSLIDSCSVERQKLTFARVRKQEWLHSSVMCRDLELAIGTNVNSPAEHTIRSQSPRLHASLQHLSGEVLVDNAGHDADDVALLQHVRTVIILRYVQMDDAIEVARLPSASQS